MKNINKSSGYSIIIALLIIGFLLVISTGIFKLILNEMKDNRAMWDYMKAYAWAESAQELALLQIKQRGYAYYDKIDHDINNRSIVLANDNMNIWNFLSTKDVFISYDIWSKTRTYDWTLGPLEYDIIPLFYIENIVEKKVTNIDLSIILWNNSDLSWNIIWKNNWISWKGTNTIWIKKTLTVNGFVYWEKSINDFISSSNTNYLVLLNTGNSQNIEYRLNAINSSEFFSKPKTSIISSAEVWNYKQNLSTDLNNTEYLNILKYSIYSN